MEIVILQFKHTNTIDPYVSFSKKEKLYYWDNPNIMRRSKSGG